MKPFTHLAAAAIVAALALSMSACKKKEETAAVPAPAPAGAPAAPDVINVPVSLKQVTLGNKIDEATKQAALAMDSFAPADTIYAVVDTIGSGKTAIKALWTYHKGDKTAQVNETVQEIDAAGPASTEFHVSKPGGWPAGDYQVEVFLNDASAGVKKFTVK
jgi:hypothetical protein